MIAQALHRLRGWLRSLLRRRAVELEMADEMKAHLERATERLMARGMPAADARVEARREFGNLSVIQEGARDARGVRPITDLWDDLRYAARTLRRAPVFTIAATLTLVLGIGAATAMFAIIHGVLLEPLPYGSADRLVSVSTDLRSPALQGVAQAPGAYFTYKRFARRIEDIGFYRSGSANISDKVSNRAERVTATWITASTISTLQVSPIIGRSFTTDEERAHGPNVVVISEALWRTRFLASREVLGKTIDINSVPRVILGVMPERFRFPTPATQLWLPARLDPNSATVGDFSYASVARLSPRATPEEAQRELASILPRIAESFPRLESGLSTAVWLDEAKPTPHVIPLRDEITGGIARTLWILAAAAGLVLFVACANVANLLLIRADGRQLELAVREALGAGRVRVLTHFLGESVVLAMVAGAIGLAVAWVAVRTLVVFGPADIPRLTEVHVDAWTVGVTLVLSIAVAALCGAIPTFRTRRGPLSIALRENARSGTSGRARQRLRGMIATLQIAVALVVVAGSALLLRTFHLLYEEHPGFDASNVATFWMQLPFARYGNDSTAVGFFARLTTSVGNLPGVRAVGVTTLLPLGAGERNQRSFRVDGDAQAVSLPTNTIDDGYLASMSIPLLAGHGFDRLGVQRDGEVIVSRRAAITLWNDPTGKAAVGKRLGMSPAGPSYTVVGVAGDVRDRDLATPPSATVYLPQASPIDSALEPGARRSMALVVKTVGPPASIAGSVRQVVHELDPSVATYDEQAMNDVVRASTARLSFTLALMSTAAVITLVLGAIGLYGVMAYTVALRTRELGIRIALGADPQRLATMVVSQGLLLTAGGVGTGLLLFALVARFLRTFLYRVGASDPLMLFSATLALVATATLASWLPARRAARIDPANALRFD